MQDEPRMKQEPMGLEKSIKDSLSDSNKFPNFLWKEIVYSYTNEIAEVMRGNLRVQSMPGDLAESQKALEKADVICEEISGPNGKDAGLRIMLKALDKNTREITYCLLLIESSGHIDFSQNEEE